MDRTEEQRMLRCPHFHRLEIKVGDVEYTCDECQRDIVTREIVLECIRCDWSLCSDCYCRRYRLLVEMRRVEAWAQWANDQMNVVLDQGPGTHEPDAEHPPGEPWEQWANDELYLLFDGPGEPEPDAEKTPTNPGDTQEDRAMAGAAVAAIAAARRGAGGTVQTSVQ